MHVRRLILILLIVLPAAASAATTRDEKTYQVEVIAFQYVNPASNEQPVVTPPPVLPTNLVEPNDMAPAGLKLGNALDALGQNANYRVLAHHAWVESLDAGEKVPAVHIHSDDGTLDGYVHFYMSRFLHFNVDLRYTDPTDPTHPLFRIHESRRIKSNETNYFDDPHFGVLVRLTPLANDAVGNSAEIK